LVAAALLSVEQVRREIVVEEETRRVRSAGSCWWPRAEGGRDGIRTIHENGNRAGVWETSGIVDASRALGRTRSCSTFRRTWRAARPAVTL
jgi:hypothetical protein